MRCVRHRITAENVYPELLAGAVLSYLGVTYLAHKDPQYTLPALVYVAVLGTSLIVSIKPRLIRRALYGAVVVLSAVYFTGMTFGVGGAERIALPDPQTNIVYQRQLTLYETSGWVRGGPVTDGHVLALLEALRRSGVGSINAYTGANKIDFNTSGLEDLAATADIYLSLAPLVPSTQTAYIFVHTRRPGDPPACQTRNDGEGIHVARGDFTGLNPVTLRNSAQPSQPITLVCPGRVPLTYRPTA